MIVFSLFDQTSRSRHVRQHPEEHSRLTLINKNVNNTNIGFVSFPTSSAVKVVCFFFSLYNPHFLSPACPPNPLACVGDITWLLAPSSRLPATVINSGNKWIMTGRLSGSHHWPWVLLEWPLFGLTKKKKKNLFDIIAGSTLGMMALSAGRGGGGESGALHEGGEEGGGGLRNHQCRVRLYSAPTGCFMNTSLRESGAWNTRLTSRLTSLYKQRTIFGLSRLTWPGDMFPLYRGSLVGLLSPSAVWYHLCGAEGSGQVWRSGRKHLSHRDTLEATSWYWSQAAHTRVTVTGGEEPSTFTLLVLYLTDSSLLEDWISLFDILYFNSTTLIWQL